MHIRAYQARDTAAIVQLFYDTVHTVNCGDYTQAQVDAWAPANMNLDTWTNRLSQTFTYVAEQDDRVIGFAQLESNGHIDCFYGHKDFQGQGVGTQLLQQIESKASALGLEKLFTEVSITAKPFFQSKGFVIIKQQQVQRGGQLFTNFVMEKILE